MSIPRSFLPWLLVGQLCALDAVVAQSPLENRLSAVTDPQQAAAPAVIDRETRLHTNHLDVLPSLSSLETFPLGQTLFPGIRQFDASQINGRPIRLPATRGRSWRPVSNQTTRPVDFQSPLTTQVVPAIPFKLPLLGGDETPIDLEFREGLISLAVRDAPLRDVLAVLAKSQGLSILVAEDVDTAISGSFSEASFEDVMEAIFSITPYTWVRRSNVILVTRIDGAKALPPQAQGRELRVFPLNYASAEDVETVVTPLLSAGGRISVTQASVADSSKTRERVIVEDIPHYMERVAMYIAQIDQPPRQVLIEAYILEVDLQDDTSCGLDLSTLSNTSGTGILVSTPEFNNLITSLSTFTSPAYNIGIFKTGKLAGLIEAITRTTDAKALASPKVLVLNGQEAHVQIGEKLGYFVTTTTETSSLQSVEFLDTGVVLRVIPRIADDDSIVMMVKPEVSDGSIDDLGLPSERTTEVDTTIMLESGTGMVIGGLLKETDVERYQKIPVLGSMPLVGGLFRKSIVIRERSEIIIALVPHVLPHPGMPPTRQQHEDEQLERATTPLLHGPLCEYPRPWEPELPDDRQSKQRQKRRAMNQLPLLESY